jgi:hypothetical protein
MKKLKIMHKGRPATREEIEAAILGKPLPPIELAEDCSGYRNFLAFLLYAQNSAHNDYTPCRWATLRDELKEQWLKTADTKMLEWIADEDDARRSREEGNPRAFFC